MIHLVYTSAELYTLGPLWSLLLHSLRQIPDPAAKKPEDWDEDEDGPWEAPLIENPQCKVCGEFSLGKLYRHRPRLPPCIAERLWPLETSDDSQSEVQGKVECPDDNQPEI